MKILKRLRPDLLVCRHPGLTALGSKLGIPSLFEGDANYSIGYEGVVKMGRKLYEALLTKKREANIACYVELPYTNWWLRQKDTFYFLKKRRRNSIVGDDTLCVAKEFAAAGKLVVGGETGGFKGNNYYEHETVVNARLSNSLWETQSRVGRRGW